jgi:TonB family protein
MCYRWILGFCLLISTALWAHNSQSASSTPASPQDGRNSDQLPKGSDSTPPLGATVAANLVAIRAVEAVYPIVAEQDKLQGQVVVRIVVSESGNVESTDVIGGNPVLATAATEAAKRWKFQPFVQNGKPTKTSVNLRFEFVFRDKAVADSPVTGAGEDPKPKRQPALTTVRLSQKAAQEMAQHKTAPVYPDLAKIGRIQGSVVMLAVISKEGTVRDLHLISGHPLLAPAAVHAVKQWRYKPYILDGETIEVQTTITVNFTLSGS